MTETLQARQRDSVKIIAKERIITANPIVHVVL